MKLTKTQVQSFIAKMNNEIIERTKVIDEKVAEVTIGNRLRRLEVDALTLDEYSLQLKLIIYCWKLSLEDILKNSQKGYPFSIYRIATINQLNAYIEGAIKTIDEIISASENND